MQIEWGNALALAIAGVVAIGVALGNWRHQAYRGGQPLLVLLLSLAWWSFTYAAFWLRLPGPTPFFWVDLTYLAVVILPTALLAFTLQFTGRGKWLTRARLALLAIEPVVILILLWTDARYGLFFAGKRVAGQGVIFDGGLGFYLNLVYGYGLILVSIGLLAQGWLRAKGLYRSQIAALLIGLSVPILTNIASLLGYSPFPNLDLTPITFTITGSIFAYALYRLGLLDIVPIARHTLVEQMSDGLVVLDAQDRVVDLNPAAHSLLQASGAASIGRRAADLFAPWPDLRHRFARTLSVSQEVELPGDPVRTIDLRIAPLYDQGGQFEGRLIILRDVTQRVEAERQLRAVNVRLTEQLQQIEALQTQLREQSIRDPLTGVFNRRFLEESLRRELANAKRKQETLAVVMLDIDQFKDFNDVYGHAAGDTVLRTLAGILNESTRAGDIVCRYGGDEFIIMLPGTSAEIARKRIDECRQRFEGQVFEFHDGQVKSSISAGIASFPDSAGDDSALLEAADQALYQAKEKGRNTVAILHS